MSRTGRERSRSATREKTSSSDERLSEYTRADAVLDLVVDSKEGLLRSLAEVVVPGASAAVVEKIYEGIEERERAVNTYVGSGVAIPHARVDCVDGISVAIARNPEGFPYGIETPEPVVLTALVVANEKLQAKHFQLLGTIANRLVDRTLRDGILQAADGAAVLRLLDSYKVPGRRKARPLTQLLLSHARKISKELGATSVLVHIESSEELAVLRRLPRRRMYIVATSSRPIAEEAEKLVERVLLLPPVPRSPGVKLSALMALTHGLVARGDVVAFLSGHDSGGLDTLTILEMGKQFGRFVTATGALAPGITPEALERVITLAAELGEEGREGKPLGTLFVVVGDEDKMRPYVQQMVINPFRGYPEEERNILDPTLAETIKEFAAIDGAFVVRGDGVVLSGGTYVKVDEEVDLPGGYGSRHRVAAAITKAVNCVSVALSQSSGDVTIFKSGQVVLTLPRSGR